MRDTRVATVLLSIQMREEGKREKKEPEKEKEEERPDWKNARNLPAFTQVPCHADY